MEYLIIGEGEGAAYTVVELSLTVGVVRKLPVIKLALQP